MVRRGGGAPSPGLSPTNSVKQRGGEVTRAATFAAGARPSAPDRPRHPSPEVGGGVGRRREERAKRRPGERAPRGARDIEPAPNSFGSASLPAIGVRSGMMRRGGGAPLSRPLPHKLRGGEVTRAATFAAGARPQCAGPAPPPLPRSWGRGRSPSRGTSEKAAGGEGSPRRARSSILLRTRSAPHPRTHALTHSVPLCHYSRMAPTTINTAKMTEHTAVVTHRILRFACPASTGIT
jgi:hypothetical protein